MPCFPTQNPRRQIFLQKEGLEDKNFVCRQFFLYFGIAGYPPLECVSALEREFLRAPGCIFRLLSPMRGCRIGEAATPGPASDTASPREAPREATTPRDTTDTTMTSVPDPDASTPPREGGEACHWLMSALVSA